jgi:hypothetical protein
MEKRALPTSAAVGFAALALALAACGGDSDDAAAPGSETRVQATTTAAPAEPIVVELEEVDGSGQSGTATLVPGKVGTIETFDVRLEIAPTRDAPQMAHVHRVTCAEYAALKGGIEEKINTVHSPLTDVRNGESESKNVSGSIATGEFSINIHEPAHPFPATVCGDIPSGGQ